MPGESNGQNLLSKSAETPIRQQTLYEFAHEHQKMLFMAWLDETEINGSAVGLTD
jgi:hypothetical protein